MKISKIKLAIVCVHCCFLFFACKSTSRDNKENNKTENDTESKNKYQFQLNLATGDKIYYTIFNETKTKLEVNDQIKETDNNYEVGLIYEVEKDSLGNTILKIKYDKIHIVIKNKDEEDEILDADNNGGAFDSVEKILAFIKGSPITITLSKTGNILNVKGNKEIIDKVMGSLTSNDLNTKNKVQELLSKLVGDGFIKNTLEQDFKIFPDSALSISNSWNRKSQEAALINFEANTKYTLSSVEDGIANVELEGTIGNEKPTTTVLMGRDVTTDLKGKQSGEIKADERSGLVLSGKLKTSIEGTIQVMGKEVPITIIMNKEIKSRRL